MLTRKHRILIAEDDPSIAQSLEFLFRAAEFDVRVASDGPSALRLASAFEPELVVIDVMMPHLSGVEVCRALRGDPRLQSARIIMVTARGRPEEMREGMNAGADLYFTKPFSTREMLAQARSLLVTAAS